MDDTLGLALAAFVRATCRNTRTMILTHHASCEIETEAMLLGVDGFLRKPLPLAEVERQVASLLEAVQRLV
jgi:ActR/RegA family two-component response regulator